MSDEVPSGSVAFDPAAGVGHGVRAVPRTTFQLDEPPLAYLDEVKAQVELTGSCRNLPSRKIPCRVSWQVKIGDTTREERYRGATPHLVVEGRRCRLTLRVDAVQLRLYGEGALGVVVQPLFPFCPSSKLKPFHLRFHNVCKVFAEAPAYPRIGSRLWLRPMHQGAFQSAAATRVRIFEIDEGEGVVDARRGYSRELQWPPEEGASATTPQSWVIGVDPDRELETPKDELGPFQLEPLNQEGEVLAYEFGAQFAVRLAGQTTWLEVPGELVVSDAPPVKQVEHPPGIYPVRFSVLTGPVGAIYKANAPLADNCWVYVFTKRPSPAAPGFRITLDAELFATNDHGKPSLWRVDWSGGGKALKYKRVGDGSAEAYYPLEIPPDEAQDLEVYIALSRDQLPYWRLRYYAGEPKEFKDPKKALGENLARLQRRCLRFAPTDETFRSQFVVEGADAGWTVAVPDFMGMAEEMQAKAVAALEAYRKFVDDPEALKRNYLAGLTGSVIDALGEDKVKKWISVTAVRQEPKLFERRAQELYEYADWEQQRKLRLVAGRHEWLFNNDFVSNGYPEVAYDYAAFRDDDDFRKPDLKDAKELEVYEKLLERWQDHLDDLLEGTNLTKSGAQELERLVAPEETNWWAEYMNSAKAFQDGRKALSRGVNLHNGILRHMRELTQAKVMSKGADGAKDLLAAFERPVSTRMPIYKGIDPDSAIYVVKTYGNRSFFALPLRAVAEGESVAVHVGYLHIPARDAKDGAVLVEGRTTKTVDLQTFEDDAKVLRERALRETGARASYAPFMLFVNSVNLHVTVQRALEVFKSKESDNWDKAREVARLLDHLGSVLNSLEYISARTAWTNTKLSPNLRRANIVGLVFSALGSLYDAIQAVKKGNFGEATGHSFQAIGAAAMIGGALIRGGTAIAWTGVGVVLTIVGLVLVWIFSEEKRTPLELWLDGSPWGYQKLKHAGEPLTDLEWQTRRLVEIAMGPRVSVSYSGMSMFVTIRPVMFFAKETTFTVKHFGAQVRTGDMENGEVLVFGTYHDVIDDKTTYKVPSTEYPLEGSPGEEYIRIGYVADKDPAPRKDRQRLTWQVTLSATFKTAWGPTQRDYVLQGSDQYMELA